MTCSNNHLIKKAFHNRDMNKEQLTRYYEALHYALDREMVEEPPTAFKALRKDCRQLERRLQSCPGGDELITEAKEGVLFARY